MTEWARAVFLMIFLRLEQMPSTVYFLIQKKKLENYKARPFHVLAFQGRANVYAHK